MKNITLIVLAGGEGKRFWPFTTSKALFPFFGMPLFAHTIADARVAKMIIVTNPKNDEAIRSYHFPIPTSTVIQKEARGMADAMLACRGVIKNSSIIVLNVDDVVDSALLLEISKTSSFGAIPGWKVPKYGPFGYLSLFEDRVTGIVEKPDVGKEPSSYANIVCHYIADGSEFISELSKTKSATDDVYEKALTALMVREQFAFVPYEGPFAQLKHPWHVLDVMRTLFGEMESHKGKNIVIKSNVVIEGQVYIGDNVKIFENTKIVGPVFIGKNTIIGNNCIIRGSHIGADCVVGFNCDITRSYIGDNCWFHSNYIGDSVLEKNISMGSGAVLANLRLDDGKISSTGLHKLGAMIGCGVRIGVNASIMPGIKIGKNSFVGSGVVLDKDLPENSFCALKPGYTVTKNTKNASSSRDAFKKNI
jgi:bifunctional UDP-N-acetylglucosamine pyrophosphorylase/glucosamine-1-phosphate N-acetyltransferase